MAKFIDEQQNKREGLEQKFACGPQKSCYATEQEHGKLTRSGTKMSIFLNLALFILFKTEKKKLFRIEKN